MATQISNPESRVEGKIPASMRAAVYRAINQISVETVPVPVIGPGELLVKIASCGICGTDLKKIHTGSHSAPRIFGHEMAGTIVKVGLGVTQYTLGERVMVHHHVPCGQCYYCRKQTFAQCPVYKKVGATAGFEPSVTAVFAGIGETDIDAYVNNSGYLQAQSGTLSLNGGGSSAGANLFVAGNAVLQFGTMAGGAAGPAFAITSGQYTAGDTAITGGTLDVSAASAAVFVNQLEITAGTLQLGSLSDGVDQGALEQSGGLLTGSGLFTVYGGGVADGRRAERCRRPPGCMAPTCWAGRSQLDGGRTVENDGWMNWSSGNIALGSGDASAVSQTGTITNVAGAVFYVTSDGRIGTSGAGGGTLNNAGVVAVFAGAGETDIDAYVNDTGGIQAQSGVLGLNGGGTANAGNLFVASNAVVQFGTMAATGTGGTFVFDGGPYIGSHGGERQHGRSVGGVGRVVRGVADGERGRRCCWAGISRRRRASCRPAGRCRAPGSSTVAVGGSVERRAGDGQRADGPARRRVDQRAGRSSMAGGRWRTTGR